MIKKQIKETEAVAAAQLYLGKVQRKKIDFYEGIDEIKKSWKNKDMMKGQ